MNYTQYSCHKCADNVVMLSNIHLPMTVIGVRIIIKHSLAYVFVAM